MNVELAHEAPALDREPERVVNDVEDGFVTRDEARDIYGVMIDGNEPVLNSAATQRLRADLKKQRLQDRP